MGWRRLPPTPNPSPIQREGFPDQTLPFPPCGVRGRGMRGIRTTLLVLLALCMASLACWSNDTLFIPPTETPTVTPVPPTPNVDSQYKIGDNLVIAGQGMASVYLTEKPEPETRSNRMRNGACYPNTSVQVAAIQRVGDVTYYQVACNGVSGWVAEAKLKVP